MYTIGCRHENCIFGSVHLDVIRGRIWFFFWQTLEHCRCICALYDVWDTNTRIAFSWIVERWTLVPFGTSTLNISMLFNIVCQHWMSRKKEKGPWSMEKRLRIHLFKSIRRYHSIFCWKQLVIKVFCIGESFSLHLQYVFAKKVEEFWTDRDIKLSAWSTWWF
jgi:hypothetical protein